MDSTNRSSSADNDLGVMYKLGNIEAQLEAINAKLDLKESAQDKEISELKADVSKLKEWRLLQMGGAGAIAAVVGLLMKVMPIG